jgi:glycosyltransferase involved in cell wall biosynthesis
VNSSSVGSSLLTIITVCRNAADALQNTIDSLRCQRSRDFAYVVIDGASTDSTASVLQNNADIITKSISEPDSGIADAFNRGISYSQTRWVIFLNAGDRLWDEDTVKVLYSAITENSDADVIYGDALAEGRDETIPVHCDHSAVHKRAPGNPVCHQAALIRRELLAVHPYSTKFQYSMDYDWLLRALARGDRFAKINTRLCRYELGGLSSSPKHAVAALKEHWLVYRSNFPERNVSWLVVAWSIFVLRCKLVFRRVLGDALYTRLKSAGTAHQN